MRRRHAGFFSRVGLSFMSMLLVAADIDGVAVPWPLLR